MTERGLEPWSEDVSARERVREVATTLTEPRSVEWVRDQARVSSRQTAKEELEMLVEFGQLSPVEGDSGDTKYAPNYQRRYFDELAQLINHHTRVELREEIATIQAEIDEGMAEFSVESRTELEGTLSDEALDSEAIQQRNRVLRRWERYEDNKHLLKHALELYDDVRSPHPKSDDSFDFSSSRQGDR